MRKIWLTLSETNRDAFLSTINYCFEIHKVDLTELGNDKVWGTGGGYRDLRPWSCCGGLPPDDEMKWHVHHIKNCLTYVGEMQDFCKQLTDLIKRKGKQLSEEKKQAIKRIKVKDVKKTCFNYSKHGAPINKCTNSQQLAKKEEEITQEIEQLSSQTQANKSERKGQGEENNTSQEEWEKRNQEETEFLYLSSLILYESKDLTTLEKNYQIVKNSPLYNISKKTFADNKEDNKNTLDNYFNTQKSLFNSYDQPGENPDSQGNNHKNDKEPNDSKNKFYELYQKEKKYSQTELMMLLQILNKLEKETDLDNNFRDAKTELQIIKDKLAPYLVQVGQITSRGETTKDKLRGLSKQELENYKKALEEMEKIIHLSELDKYLLEAINDELKTFGLEEEINQLKKNKTETPQQQEENQQKLAEKEQELERLKKDKEKKQKPTSQEIINIKNQIIQLLKTNNLKASNLPKQYQNWEEQLSKLTTKDQINTLVQKIRQQINNESKSLKREQNQKSNKQQSIPLFSVVSVVILGIMVLSYRVIRRRKIKR